MMVYRRCTIRIPPRIIMHRFTVCLRRRPPASSTFDRLESRKKGCRASVLRQQLRGILQNTPFATRDWRTMRENGLLFPPICIKKSVRSAYKIPRRQRGRKQRDTWNRKNEKKKQKKRKRRQPGRVSFTAPGAAPHVIAAATTAGCNMQRVLRKRAIASYSPALHTFVEYGNCSVRLWMKYSTA